MSSPTELICPNCGAPITPTTSLCAYCKMHLVQVTPSPDAAPTAPPGGRVERLAGLLNKGNMPELWSLAGPAWSKRRGGTTLNDEESFACDVLLAALGTALIAVRGQDTPSLASALSTISGKRLAAADAHAVLVECQKYLDAEGQEACLAQAAELLYDAEIVEGGYALAVGITLLRGTISVDQGKALDAIADAYDISNKKAKKTRQKIGEALAT